MTMVPVVEIVEDIEELITDSTGHGHIACCAIEPKIFLCGAPYHPECDIEAEVDCARCKKIQDRARCFAGHQHCPLVGVVICPSKKEGA